jgi:NADPH2:quinone reductase
MLAVRVNQWMPYRDLQVEDVADPVPGPGEVRIAVHYAGVSFATSLVTEGKYQRKPPLPFSPGTEVAGVIDLVGSGVTRFKPGDRVVAGIDWGGHAEYAVTDASTAYLLPDELPFDIAPSLPASYGTSCAALDQRARLQPGETLLVHGAAGAVGNRQFEEGVCLPSRLTREVGLGPRSGSREAMPLAGFRACPGPDPGAAPWRFR